MSETGELKRHQSTPEQDLKDIATNTLINSLVHTYWSDDLTAIELRNKANKAYSERKYEEALVLYNRAFSLSPNDHLILGNRSIAHLKSGNSKAALEDAELAVSLRPDWAKGHLRRGNALKTLRRHEEAFKALFSCLVLEKTALAKPVKQELAKELHQLLRIANECERCVHIKFHLFFAFLKISSLPKRNSSFYIRSTLYVKKSMTYIAIFLYSEQPNFYLKQREKSSIHLMVEHEIDDLER